VVIDAENFSVYVLTIVGSDPEITVKFDPK
jgi:hypothetical protein